MNSRIISWLKYLVLLAAAILLLALAFRGASVRNIVHGILQAKMSWVLISGFFSVVAFISRAYRWKLLIEPLGYRPSLRQTVYSLMVGYFANLALPRLGEVSRCGALGRAASIPFNQLLGTVIVERLVDVVSLLTCMVLVALTEQTRLGNFFLQNIFYPATGKFVQLTHSPPAIALAVILLAAIVFFVWYFLKNSGKKGVHFRVQVALKGLVTGLRSVASLRRPWLFVFHSIFIWFMYFLGAYACFFALTSTAGLGNSAALFLVVASGLGMAAPVQGGIGAYHILVSRGLVLYGLSLQDGLTFATLLHGIQLVLVILLGTVSLFLLFLGKKKVIAITSKP